MPKEKNYNPVQAAKKAEKQKQLKKQKANVQAQRNEKLARRNPARIQRDIDNLKELEQGGSLRPHEKQRLIQLEKDLAAVNKARAALGEQAPQFKPERRHDEARRGRGGGVLGKRTRDGNRKSFEREESSDTDDDVKDIPMPGDTPPPIPRRKPGPGNIPQAPQEPKKPTLVYEAAPQHKDLVKEATRFVPAVVAQKMKLAKGEGKLMEPEEFDQLEKEGYLDIQRKKVEPADPELEELLLSNTAERMTGFSTAVEAEQATEEAVKEAEYRMMASETQGEINSIGSETKVAERALHQVEIEEVEDEDV